MDLINATRFSHPEGCYVCRWVGKDGVIWPLQPEGSNNSSQAQFWVFVNPRERNQQDGFKGGKRTIDLCPPHADLIYRNWVQIAQDEVSLQKAWDAWIERTE